MFVSLFPSLRNLPAPRTPASPRAWDSLPSLYVIALSSLGRICIPVFLLKDDALEEGPVIFVFTNIRTSVCHGIVLSECMTLRGNHG